jgi:hypothetical protein
MGNFAKWSIFLKFQSTLYLGTKDPSTELEVNFDEKLVVDFSILLLALEFSCYLNYAGPVIENVFDKTRKMSFSGVYSPLILGFQTASDYDNGWE